MACSRQSLGSFGGQFVFRLFLVSICLLFMNYLITILVHIVAYSISSFQLSFFFPAHFYGVLLLKLEDLLYRVCNCFCSLFFPLSVQMDTMFSKMISIRGHFYCSCILKTLHMFIYFSVEGVYIIVNTRMCS